MGGRIYLGRRASSAKVLWQDCANYILGMAMSERKVDDV
jgi:hypothetical protein